ncbi:unnamed protein product, partial [Candidula unifasciata]
MFRLLLSLTLTAGKLYNINVNIKHGNVVFCFCQGSVAALVIDRYIRLIDNSANFSRLKDLLLIFQDGP